MAPQTAGAMSAKDKMKSTAAWQAQDATFSVSSRLSQDTERSAARAYVIPRRSNSRTYAGGTIAPESSDRSSGLGCTRLFPTVIKVEKS